MKIGTKSLLYGAHQFALHPFFVVVVIESVDGAGIRPPDRPPNRH